MIMKKGIFTIVLVSLTFVVFSQSNGDIKNQGKDNNAGGIWNYVDEQTAITLDSAKAYTDRKKQETINASYEYTDQAKADAIKQSNAYTDTEIKEYTCPLIHWSSEGVGIGTPAFSDFMLSVDGKAIFEEVEIEMSDKWADFVFEDDYKLMPIKELDNFIGKNKHLPGVPTTTEVKENGISVGEMNKLLLQKVEELSLYVIQLETRIDEMEAK